MDYLKIKEVAIKAANAFKEFTDMDKIMLITSYGIITGYINQFDTKEKLEKRQQIEGVIDVNISFAVAEAFKACELNPEKILRVNEASIYKDNLTTPIIRLNEIIVFLDQIIAYSLCPEAFDEKSF